MLARPILPPGTHPIEVGDYTFPTPVVLKLKEKVEKWVSRRVTGGMIFGPQRNGKTTATEYIYDELKSHYGENSPIFYIPLISLSTVVQFLMHFLKYTYHQLYLKGTEVILRDRLINYLIGRAMQDKTKRVILFIDEAQLLTRLQAQVLVDLQNELRAQNIYGSFFLVGQPELKHMVHAYQTSENLQFVGRFMVNQVEFTGLQNVKELNTCLGIYDELATYPENSEWTYTRYYAPEAYDAGWRLRHHAQAIWDAFAEIRITEHLPIRSDLPMEWLTDTIGILLREMICPEADFQGFTFNQIKGAILESNYVNICRNVLRPKKDPQY